MSSRALLLAVAVVGCGERAASDTATPSQSSTASGSSAVTGVASTATSAVPSAAVVSPVDAFMMRLDAISVTGQALAKDPKSAARYHLALIMDADGKIGGTRETLPMRFDAEAVAAPPDSKGRSFVGLAARFGADPACSLAFGIEILDQQLDVTPVNPLPSSTIPTTPDPAKKDTVRFTVGHPSSTPPCLPARMHVAKLWSLLGADTRAKSAVATLDGLALGTHLRRNEAPASFSHPGEGSWSLFAIKLPGEAYIAIDWEHGELELFPKDVGVRTPAGDAIFNAF